MRLFYVKMVRCASGERLPTLMHGTNGVPDFDATLWVVSSLRGKNSSSATIEQALRSIALLNNVLSHRHIDLNARFRDCGPLLDQSDLEAIAKATKQQARFSEIVEPYLVLKSPAINSKRVLSLNNFRVPMTDKGTNSRVAPSTAAIRIGYIRAYLNWRIRTEIMRSSKEQKANLALQSETIEKELKSKTPSVARQGNTQERMGIDKPSQELLLSVIRPGHEQNPWIVDFIKARNELIIHLFLSLGIRRSELLGLRLSDLKPQTQEIWILRRPDDKQDPRVREPNTKTNDRILPIASAVYNRVQKYLIYRHEKVSGRHGYLMIANTGAPLSMSALNRIFVSFDHTPNLKGLFPHILRHTFCENLAAVMHDAGLSENEILVYLRRLGGWSDNSSTPCRYIKRFIQEQASAAALAMQKSLYITSSTESNDEDPNPNIRSR